MKKTLLVTLALMFATLSGCGPCPHAKKGCKQCEAVAHNVYFTLKNADPAEQEKLAQACHTYLKCLPGIVFFAAGTRAEEYEAEVHVTDYHVGLHVIFKNSHYYDEYEKAPKHLQLIEEYKDNWLKVRVFDTKVR